MHWVPSISHKLSRQCRRIRTVRKPTQMAFASTTTRACCLIQGPPGTGKSYAGIKIVETFRKQPRHLSFSSMDQTPILCVWYTNHGPVLGRADHECECELSEIVRVGGRSKSEILQTQTLMNLETCNSITEHHAFGRLYRQCKDQEEEAFTA